MGACGRLDWASMHGFKRNLGVLKARGKCAAFVIVCYGNGKLEVEELPLRRHDVI